MIAYVDSSVILRVILKQRGPLHEWNRITNGIVSRLAEVECTRTLDRQRIADNVGLDELALRREAVNNILDELTIVEITRTVLTRAGQPMVAPLGSLDAIHLATAELWRESQDQEILFATHDHALGLAARASGFKVIGVE